MADAREDFIPESRTAQELRDIALAKQLLMDRRGMTEPEAHRLLQKESQRHRIPKARIAALIICADQEVKSIGLHADIKSDMGLSALIDRLGILASELRNIAKGDRASTVAIASRIRDIAAIIILNTNAPDT